MIYNKLAIVNWSGFLFVPLSVDFNIKILDLNRKFFFNIYVVIWIAIELNVMSHLC